jgi:ABC-type nitrate/sulfonate/bicarbonate transport system ATPase subunit
VDGDVALMPQRDALMPWLTLRDNVAMGAVLGGLTRDRAAGRADAALVQLGLEGFGEHYPHALSGGMRQRGALARTLLADRATWLLDEPFGALDALTRSEMHRVLTDLRAHAEPTILLVTHDIAEAVALADHVLVASSRPMRVVASIDVDPDDRFGGADQVMDALRAAGAAA